MLEKIQNYLPDLNIGNDITKWLSYEEAIKKYTAKKCRIKSIIEVCQTINKNIMLFFCILLCLWYLSPFLICDLLPYLILNKYSLSCLILCSFS